MTELTEASSPPHISNNKNTTGITLQDHHGQYFTPFSVFVGFECVYLFTLGIHFAKC